MHLDTGIRQLLLLKQYYQVIRTFTTSMDTEEEATALQLRNPEDIQRNTSVQIHPSIPRNRNRKQSYQSINNVYSGPRYLFHHPQQPPLSNVNLYQSISIIGHLRDIHFPILITIITATT